MLNYYIVDAFTDRPFGGNTAGVVLLEGNDFPSDALMQSIAAELRYSETAFVRRLAADDYRLRYFTPRSEVELCGHATVASFALMHSLGVASGTCRCRTLAGDLEVVAGSEVLMQMATPRIVKTLNEEEAAEAYRAVGFDGHRAPLPVQVAYAGLPDIMLPVPPERLDTLQPDMDAIAALTARHEAISLHAFALADAHSGLTARVRDFAPGCGVPEESATGTANAALAHMLRTLGLVAPDGVCRFLQGEAMGRPSVVSAHLSADGDVRIGGHAALVARGQLLV